jgi:hypothetical protein
VAVSLGGITTEQALAASPAARLRAPLPALGPSANADKRAKGGNSQGERLTQLARKGRMGCFFWGDQ